MNAPALVHPVRFTNLGREALCRQGETLFQAARQAGIRLVGACGGRGACGTCLVRVTSGEFSYLAEARSDGWLRACKLVPLGACEVELAARSLAPIVRAEVGARDAALVFDPAVRVHDLTLAAPDLAHAAADADQLLAALAGHGIARLDSRVLRELPGLLRANDWKVRAVSKGDEVIAIGAPGARVLGLAVDLGTTNVAGFLIDLETGARLGTLGIENPQASYGADVVSRVNHAIRAAGGAQELRAAAAVAIGELARDLCEAAGASTREIVEITVCGNTAMHHLFLGLPVAQLGRAPFVPAVCAALDMKAGELSLPPAALHVMPNVGGFVGGDHVAALLATEERWRGRTALVIDIGTNTEVSLVHADAISTVSCPSGPALEGGHISCGMRAAEGAIERVKALDGRLELKTIGEATPVGICGSGVVDAVAACRALGLIDRRGRIASGSREIVLAPGVAFTQADVRAVQLAKAAIRAGIDLLLESRGLASEAIERVLIAGAFGEYLGVEAALAIGLLPPLPRERIEQVGNAAGAGVALALASARHRTHAGELAQRCRYIELGSLPQFQKTFMRSIALD
ncbi:MAG TPA: ASKHA domain-containing protein [Burkholderiales bacterium]